MRAAGIEKDQFAPTDQFHGSGRQGPFGVAPLAKTRRQRLRRQRQGATIDPSAKSFCSQRPEITPDGIFGNAEFDGELDGRHRLPFGEAGGDQITTGKGKFIGHTAL